MTVPVRPISPAPRRVSRRRRVRRFWRLWIPFTLLVGTATFAGLFLASASLGNASEENNDAEISVQVNTPNSVAAAPTNTEAPPAGTPVPTVPPTVVPTINAPEIDGTLPADFEIGAHFTGEYDKGDAVWTPLRIAGMSWVKIQLRFERGMKADDYGWQLDLIRNQGFKVLWGVVGAREDVLADGYFEEYATFVGRLAEIGSHGIEVWNEVNLDREWPNGSVDPALYTELLKAAYTEIKAKNPDTLVISAGLAPTGFFGGCTAAGCDDHLYYQGLASAGAADYMDCIGAHYNEGIVSPTATSGDPRDTDYPTRYLQSNTERAWAPFGGEKPVCYTELGYLTPEGYAPLPGGFSWAQNVTLAQHASWLGTAALINAQSGKVRLMIIWNLDFTRYDDDPVAGYAIIRQNGECPACDTLGSLR
jgi:hypothetical protein